MPISREDEAQLLTALHQGAFEASPWATFLDRLRMRVGAGFAGLNIRPGDAILEKGCLLGAGNCPTDAFLGEYFKSYMYSEPIDFNGLEPGKTYSLAEFFDPEDERHQFYHQYVMVPCQFSHIITMRIAEPEGYNAWLIAWKDGDDFGVEETSLFNSLGPHLTIALRSFAMKERERVRASIAAEAIRRLNFGWLTMDIGTRIVDFEPEADRLIQRLGPRRVIRGKPLMISPKVDRTIAEILATFQDNPDARARAIHISDEPWMEMLVVPMRDKEITGAVTPVAIAYIHGDRMSGADRMDQLMDLFGLSRTEAGLALRLTYGRTIAEAADDMSLTIETARNYSKRIYSKTGTRGQADLVRMLMTSVVTLA